MYVVAPGFAFTSRRGMIKEGEEITEKDFVSHEAFVKAVAKEKIIVGKNKEQIAAEEKAAAEKAKAEQLSTAEKAKKEAITAARQAKETAETALTAAKNRLDEAGILLEKANVARADIEAKVAPAQEALKEKENSNGEIAAARKLLSDAEEELAKAKKPEQKAAAEGNVSAAKAELAKAEQAIPELKELSANLATLNSALEEAEVTRIEAEAKVVTAKEAVTLAEAEFEKTVSNLAALEGK